MLNTTSPRPTEVAGPPVTASPPAVHRLVHLTCMHGLFVQQSVNDWVQRDIESQEAGTPDDLAYLARSVGFMITAIQRIQGMADICREQNADKAHILEGIEAVIPVLKSINLDTGDSEAQCKALRFHLAQFNAASTIHDGTVEQMSQLLVRLQTRIDDVMRPPGQFSSPSRPN